MAPIGEIRRILALADTHGRLPDLDVSQADCVMIAGDVSPGESYLPEFQRPWLEGEFFRWVEALGRPVYLALGNHDFISKFDGPPNLKYGTHDIVDDVLLFSFTPYYSGNWAWEDSELFLAQALRVILDNRPVPPIWLSHSPPWGVCDGRDKRDKNGSLALWEAIVKHQPRLFICGHIHRGAGQGKLGKTRIYNVAVTRGFANAETMNKPIDREPVLIEL
jgi:Icc-related predicted phosphoesterase